MDQEVSCCHRFLYCIPNRPNQLSTKIYFVKSLLTASFDCFNCEESVCRIIACLFSWFEYASQASVVALTAHSVSAMARNIWNIQIIFKCTLFQFMFRNIKSPTLWFTLHKFPFLAVIFNAEKKI